MAEDLSLPDAQSLARALDRVDGEEDLLDFVRLLWPVIEPARAFVEGWVLEAMCEHLTAVSEGEITRLLINVPPGFMKSLLVDVFWPAWEWGPLGRPETRYLAFSYAEALTRRDNGRFRNLILSPLYRALWGHVFGPGDELGRRKVANDRTGWKFASSIGGVGTGERADRVIIDDPNHVRKSESKAVLESTNLWLTEVMPDRLNDQRSSAIILIQQRTNERDCSGTLLALEAGYVHLSVPMPDHSGDGIGRRDLVVWRGPSSTRRARGRDGVLAGGARRHGAQARRRAARARTRTAAAAPFPLTVPRPARPPTRRLWVAAIQEPS